MRTYVCDTFCKENEVTRMRFSEDAISIQTIVFVVLAPGKWLKTVFLSQNTLCANIFWMSFANETDVIYYKLCDRHLGTNEGCHILYFGKKYAVDVIWIRKFKRFSLYTKYFWYHEHIDYSICYYTF